MSLAERSGYQEEEFRANCAGYGSATWQPFVSFPRRLLAFIPPGRLGLLES